MARKRTLEQLIKQDLVNKTAFGQSKHLDKHALGFGESTYKIYSYSTFDTYLKECSQYAQWLKETKGISKLTDLSITEQFAKEYIQERLNNGVSVYTAKMERSALSMLYGKTIDIEMPKRDNKNISRSREESVNDKHHSRDGKYKSVFDMALGTGCRRCDLESLKVDCLVEKDGHLYAKITRSKGGRDRLVFVRKEYAQSIKEHVLKRQIEGYTKVFDKVPRKIDIHALRRDYCKKLYVDIKDNRQLRDDILKNYPPRVEYKTNTDKNGNTYAKQIKRDYYKDRDGNVYDRDDIYVLSQCLGHNRLDVSVTHYLKN